MAKNISNCGTTVIDEGVNDFHMTCWIDDIARSLLRRIELHDL